MYKQRQKKKRPCKRKEEFKSAIVTVGFGSSIFYKLFIEVGCDKCDGYNKKCKEYEPKKEY